jgi:large subunit ribosomal protein L28
MSRVCQLTGARPKSGHNVSHSKRRTKRRFLPNLITKRIWDEETQSFVRIKMTARALRTMAKNPSKYKKEISRLAKKSQKKALKNASK